MEIEGHPTQDVVEELVQRGAVRLEGATEGPGIEGLRFLTERLGDQEGFWLFLPRETFDTGLDDLP